MDKKLLIQILINVAQAKGAVYGLQQSLNLLSSTINAVFRTAVVAAFFYAIRSVVQAFSDIKTAVGNLLGEYSKLNFAATLTASVMTEGASNTAEAFKQVSYLSRDLSNQTMFTAQQIQEGLFTAAQAGYQLAGASRVASSAMVLAQETGEEYKGTVKGLIGVVKAFDIGMQEIPATVDMITAAVVKSNAELTDFFQGMSYAASATAVNFGSARDNIVDTTAAIMTMNDVSIRGSKAGVYLRAAYQGIQSGTSKINAVFAKYGVNVYQANGANQKYLGTLQQGQAAMGRYEERLNVLKKRQYDLALSGRSGSEAFNKVTQEISEVDSTLGTLGKGIDEVYQQFQLAGGKLKPFSQILADISGKVPTEVIARAFGVRAGQGITALLQNLEKFKKHRETLVEFFKASEEGESITQKMFEQLLETFLVKWQRIKNIVSNTFSTIADEFFSAVSPLLDTLIGALTQVFSFVNKNASVFKAIFTGIVASIKPIFESFAAGIMGIVSQLTTAAGGTAPFKVIQYSEVKGKIIGKEKTINAIDMAERVAAVFKSMISFVFAHMNAALEQLRPVILSLGSAFADAIVEVMRTKLDAFVDIGFKMGLGVLSAIARHFKEVIFGALGGSIIGGVIGATALGGAAAVATAGNPAAVAAGISTGWSIGSATGGAGGAIGGYNVKKQGGVLEALRAPFERAGELSEQTVNRFLPASDSITRAAENYNRSADIFALAADRVLAESAANKSKVDALSRRISAGGS